MEWEEGGKVAMDKAHFGVTFFFSSQRHDACGTNGLPVTPNSIRILGRAQFLRSLRHPNLSLYVDVIRGKSEKIITVAEYYEHNVLKLIRRSEHNDYHEGNKRALELGRNVLSGLSYLNERGIVVRNLCPEFLMICPDEKGTIKLFNYGLYYMTNSGQYVAFPIGHPKYKAPEVLASKTEKPFTSYSSDVWSLGIILIEVFFQREIWADLKLNGVIQRVLELRHCASGKAVLLNILEEHGLQDSYQEISYPVRKLMETCLELNPVNRKCSTELLSQTEIFGSLEETGVDNMENIEGGTHTEIPDVEELYGVKFFKSRFIKVPEWRNEDEQIFKTENNRSKDHLSERSLQEIYYLWQRAGGDVVAELKRQGLPRKKPAALSLPHLMTLEGSTQGKSKERGLLLDNTVVTLPLRELRKRLSDVPAEDFYPIIEFKIPHYKSEASTANGSASLPLIIRERDIEYQFHRIVLFDRLLQGYPFTKDRIRQEARRDIPPYFRAQVWSCLLDIQGDVARIYETIDKETATSTDRQIEVDIPRCHQYDELLSSPVGHEKFKRVLKAWVVSNKEYVYWQGLDSLCAPFLSLNFNNEAMAFACLSAFIPKYLYNFFLKDNSAVIQEFLSKFSQLMGFHDPELTSHLNSIGFIPELYAIPWFLTMFSHVFPLHKIFHLWDKLLLGDSSFSLCIGLAILYQLRESLLNSGFNECILLFSDMPEINIEKCVQDSVEIFSNTPVSVLRRKHEPPPHLFPEKGRNNKTSNFYDYR